MRYITLAAVTLAGVAFAGTAYPDSNNGPRQKGDQCWHRQLGDSLGYWARCRSAEAEAVRQRLLAAGRSAEEADREAERTGARGAQATRINASANTNKNTRSPDRGSRRWGKVGSSAALVRHDAQPHGPEDERR